MKFSLDKRKEVHSKYNGKCAYCGKEITISAMQIDHIVPKCANGTDEDSNLNPSCRECNNYKCHAPLELFRTYLKQMLNNKLHYLFRSKTKMQCAINFKTIKIEPWDGVFYFEKLNKKL